MTVEEKHPIEGCMEACAWCESGCLAATEACLNDLREEQLGMCLQLTLDCAEICWTTRRFMADALVVAPALVREQLACLRWGRASAQGKMAREATSGSA